jgi:NodT family efflux transporter outer membrane factor (OMF) lipoprotein
MRARLIFFLPWLAGCAAVGPNYQKPDIATPDSFAAENAPLSVPQAGEADLTDWWTGFHDAELDSLIARALNANLDLKTAASRVREAREQEIISGAAGLPSVSAMADPAHLHSGRNILSQLAGGSSSSSSSGSGGSSSSGSTDVTLYSLGFDATWEIDVFGGVRRSVEAAQAGSEAARWEMRDGEVTLTAEIATDYISLRSAQARLAILAGEIKSQNATLDLVSARARTGFVTELDVNQQYALRATTQAQIPALEAQARTMEHAIAVLLAVSPNALAAELDQTAPLPEIPASLPVGLPSDLLRRRPDIREAERKLAQATANEGVAIAALYPKFNLIGAVNLASNSLGSLFNSSSLSELALGMISWPLFKGGEGHANVRAKEEEQQQAYFAYQKAVLAAVQDCEDALVRYAAEQRRFSTLQEAVTRDHSSVAIAGQQYQAGLTNYVNVLTAEGNELQANDQLAQSKEALAADLASLHKALGGGWHENDDPGTTPPDREGPLQDLDNLLPAKSKLLEQ